MYINITFHNNFVNLSSCCVVLIKWLFLRKEQMMRLKRSLLNSYFQTWHHHVRLWSSWSSKWGCDIRDDWKKLNNRSVQVREIADTLGISIERGVEHFNSSFEYEAVFISRWVSRLLIIDYKLTRSKWFLALIHTVNETWIHYTALETKK